MRCIRFRSSLIAAGLSVSSIVWPTQAQEMAKAEAPLGVAFLSGNELYNECTGSDGVALSFCVGYIIGVADVLFQNEINKYTACAPPPPSLTQGQVRDVVIAWLRNNPTSRNFGAAGVVAHALSEAFPCGNTS